MKKNLKITLTAIIFLLNLTTVFGQSSDKIIFLTDFYTSFIDKVKADYKSSDNIYKENIQFVKEPQLKYSCS